MAAIEPWAAATETAPDADIARAYELLGRQDSGEELSGMDKDDLGRLLADHPEIRPEHNGSLDNNGGSIAGGYYFADNVSPDTATVDWIELRGDPGATWPTFSSTDGGTTGMQPIGFGFRFFGTVRDSFKLGVDGFIHLTNSTATASSNADLPYASFATPSILALWDDLRLDVYGGTVSDRVAYKNFGTYTVIEYDSVAQYFCTGQPVKFEVILFNDGRIKMQYLTVPVNPPCTASYVNSSTVGIQAMGTGPAVRYVYNATGFALAANRAIWFVPANPAHDYSVSAVTAPVTGTYGPSQTLTVTGRFANLGTTVESAPVKYSFNGGATEEEATASLAQYDTELHTFAASITLPAVNGPYVLTMWSDLATDLNRANDTARVTLTVFAGGSCNTPIELTTAGPDSATWNNTGAGTNDPGISCATTTYNDMVFKKDVLAGHTVTIWVSSISATSKSMNASLRWSGNCRGDSLVNCVSSQSSAGLTGYNRRFVWTNSTGATQTVYFTYGTSSSSASYAGNFKLAWIDTDYAHDYGITAITNPTTTQYGPSEALTVTATAKNHGSAVESAPVKYSFNGGGTVVEATAVLNRFATEDHSFATQITLPAANGTYPLTVWTDLADDQDRANDTLKMNVIVFGGANCGNAFVIATAGPDSATFNNCGAGDNNPGTTCYPTSSYADMVFSKVVDPGHTVTFWVSSMTATSKYLVATLRWGGSCPGTNVVDCPAYMTSAPAYNRRFTWTNSTGATQTAFFTMGNYYSGTSYCNNIKLAWQDQICAALDVPVVETFESIPYIPTLPGCWTQENNDGISPVWNTSTTYAYGGTKSVAINGLTAGLNDWLFTPGINLEEGREYYIRYFRRNSSSTIADSIELKAGIAPTASAMSISVAPTDTCKSTAFVMRLGGFTAPASGVYYLGWHAMQTSSSAYTYIDSVKIDASTECTAPTVTVNSVIAADSATLVASVSGGSGGGYHYQWYTGPTCTPANAIAGATGTTYKTFVAGAFACRVYILDSLTCVSCDSAMATVIDCGIPVTLPLVEGFEFPVQPVLPPCWTQLDVNADGRPWRTNTNNPRTGTQNAYNQYSTGTATNDYLFSRPVALQVGTPYIAEYWYRCSIASASYTEALEVLVGQTTVPAEMTTIDPLFTFSNISTYTLRSVGFSVPSTGTYYVAWHAGGGINQGGVLMDDIAIYPDTSCLAPTSVTVTGGTGQDAVVLAAAFTGGQGAPHYQWFTGLGTTAGNEIVDATAATYTATASGVYTCKVWRGWDATGCAAWDSCYADVVICSEPLTTLPVYESFEYTTGQALPACWDSVDVNADSRPWRTNTNYPRTGLRNAYNQYSTGSATDDWMFSRGISLTANDTIMVEYWYRCSLTSASYSESLELKAGSTPEVASMAIVVDTNFTFSAVSAYTQRAGRLIVPSSGTYYFGWHAGYLINQGGVVIDDITIYRYGTCGAPQVTVPAVMAQTAVTLTCNTSGGHGGLAQYQWYTGTPCTPGNEIAGATNRTYTTFSSGIFSCKAWMVDPVTCSGCDSAVATVTPDPCLPGGLPPMYEPWSAASLPTCWSQENANGDGYSWSYGSSYYVSSPYAAYLYTSTTPANDWLFSGPLQLTADSTYRIEYWRRASSATYAQTLKLAVGTNRHSTAMTTTLLAPYTFNNVGTGAAAFVQDVAQYTAPATGSYYFGLQNLTSVSGGSVYADDFRIYKVGDCAPPTSVTVNSMVGADSAVLACAVVGGFGSAVQYQWYNGATCTAGNEIVGATNATFTTMVSGDYACKAYYAGSDACALCDSATATVVQCNVAPTLPYSEGFESVTTPALPICWTMQDVNNDARKWVGSTNSPHGGTKSAYVQYSVSTSAADDWLFSRPVSLVAGQMYVVDYWFRSYLTSTSYIERLEVKAGSTANPAAMTIAIDPLFNFMSSTYDMHSAEFSVPITGLYYLGWHCASSPNAGGVILDDINVYTQGPCGAPTVTVPATPGSGNVTLTATATGGFGGSLHYQWYTGTDCLAGNQIAGATGNQYVTTVSGTFSCKAWRADEATCWSCDSAYADIIPPQPGETCATALTITTPTTGVPTVVAGTTVGFWPNYPNTCVSGVSNDADVYYQLTLAGQPSIGCRRIAMALSGGGDMHLAVYQGLANCGGTALLCNDDVAEFTNLPGWDVPAQHPASATASYVAADLEPGTYLIRVARFTTAGACTLSVYDNGACYEPCDPATGLTVYMSLANPSQVWWHFVAPSQGSYKIFTTTVRNNDGNPDNGADPQWSLDTTLEVLAAGTVECIDLDGGPSVNGYENFAVVHDCPIIGRCCYGDPFAPTCADNTEAQCQGLSGSWNRYRRCATDPCPVVQPEAGEDCVDATLLGGPLPIRATGITTGHVRNYPVTPFTANPTCWGEGTAASGFNGPDVCWKWIVPVTGTYTFALCNGATAWDTCLLLLNDTGCPTPTDVICADDDHCPADTRSMLSSVSLTAGQHVLVVVGGYGTTSMGAFQLDITTP